MKHFPSIYLSTLCFTWMWASRGTGRTLGLKLNSPCTGTEHRNVSKRYAPQH